MPFAASLPVSVHTGVPVEHESVPVWHPFVGVHDVPVVHAAHVPLLQTSLTPHAVPSSTFPPVSVQTGEPVEQPIDPT